MARPAMGASTAVKPTAVPMVAPPPETGAPGARRDLSNETRVAPGPRRRRFPSHHSHGLLGLERRVLRYGHAGVRRVRLRHPFRVHPLAVPSPPSGPESRGPG